MASSTIALGSCSVDICGDIDYEKNGRKISFSIPGLGTIRVSAAAAASENEALALANVEAVPKAESVIPVHPGALDGENQLIKDVVELYTRELPSAFNVSRIYDCVNDGRNLTLVLKNYQQIIAAVTYQLCWTQADGACAVILLAAVQSSHQRKGTGTRLYAGLQKRLRDIGISTVYCSPGNTETFWTKQGFDVFARSSAKPKLSGQAASLFPDSERIMISETSSSRLRNTIAQSIRNSMPYRPGSPNRTCPVPDEKADRRELVPCNTLRTDNAGSTQTGNKEKQKNSKKRDRGDKFDSSSKSLRSPSQTPKTIRPDPSTSTPFDLRVPYRNPVVMFMDMADDHRKSQLTKFVENLGGQVTDNGSLCTHVLTGQIRRTVNFCAALCVGAWIVSPEWLKTSVQEKKFVDPTPFILEDSDFRSNYKTDVASVVKRARTKPLFQGFQAYLTPQVDPQLGELIKSGGGKVVSGINELAGASSSSFVIADGIEPKDAVAAGIRAFDTAWLLRSIMRQELDFESRGGLTKTNIN